MPYMQRLMLGFCAGALLLGLPWPGGSSLPLLMVLCSAVVLVSVAAAAALDRHRGQPVVRRLLPVGLAVGLGWSGLAHDAALAARVCFEVGRSPAAVTVVIESVDAARRTAAAVPPVTRFQARVAPLPGADSVPASVAAACAGLPLPAGTTLRLTWYDAPPLRQGEVWSLRGAVRGPWSYANPGGFDFERWLLGRGIDGTGWVRGGARLAPAQSGAIERGREAVATAVADAGLVHPGVLLALLIGRVDEVPDALWEVLRRTGTVHLMVISGLHVSLATALGCWAGGWLCRLVPGLPLWVDAQRGACAGGALMSVAYVALAGGGLPAMRALVMGLCVLVLLCGGRSSRPGTVGLAALSALLALQPLAVHQQGFWLSFAAVGVLLITLRRRFGSGRERNVGAWVATLWRAQLALSLGLLPLVALVTGQLPWLGVPANVVAVPVLSLCVVPAALLAGMLVPVWTAGAGVMLTVADATLHGVLIWLQWLGSAPLPTTPGSTVGLILAQGAALWWLLGAPRRHWPGVLLCCALPLVPRATGLAHGEYRVLALDVGQGTSVSIDTRRHRLLYDAGPGFPTGFETGSTVVVPSLIATGPARLDALILSHDDLDHTGGADAVRLRLKPRRLLAGGQLPHTPDGRGPDAGQQCDGRRWEWDGVRFHLLQVSRPPNAVDNDRSCILLVDDGRRRTLIAGDVEAAVEAALLRRLAGGRRIDLMFAPHHGSATSSSRALVRVARPRLVFVSAGRDNRFGHPHPDVVARYRRVGAAVYQTGVDGALLWRSGAPETVFRWRDRRLPYWRTGVPGSASSRR